jgi:hypothetical protein
MGLISIYAICEYPKFLRCSLFIDTLAWNFSTENNPVPDICKYLKQNLPIKTYKIYFDYGDQTFMRFYKTESGFSNERKRIHILTGKDHSEKSGKKD